MIKLIFTFLVLLILASCKSTEESTKGQATKTYEELMSGDEIIIIDNKELKTDVYIWRDLMPGSDKSTNGIYISLKLMSADSSELPLNLNVNKLWVFDKEQIWETIPGLTPSSNNQIAELYARNGPDWKPGKLVNAAFEINTGKTKIYLIKDIKVNAVY